MYADTLRIKWQRRIETFLSNQYTKGFVLQIPWEDLETSFDNYVFSDIDTYLTIASNYSKYMIIDIEISCFNDSCFNAQVPGYIRTAPAYNGGVELLYRANGTVKGSTARTWDNAVVDGIIALLYQMCSSYNSHKKIGDCFFSANQAEIANCV